MKKTLAFLLVLCAVVTQAQNVVSGPARKLQMAEYLIANQYVDKVDENKLVEEAIIKMLAQLDPHSTYSNPEEVRKMNEPLKGNFEGIGIQFQMINDTLQVMQPNSNGPSEKAGILAGDRIIAVDDTPIAGVKMSTDDVMLRLRGPKGSTVKLTIIRHGIIEPLLFTVKRDKIPIFSIDASYLIKPRTGYIRINRFSATTGEEFTTALKALQKQGMKELILDLQGNGGGYLNAAIDVANEFLGQKELIVYTEGRTAERGEFFAKGDGNFRQGRLVVLVDEYSASASEIVSGAMQDWDRAIVVGRRSFGKGLVQRPINLPDGSMIRLTVARYFTPAGRCIQKPYESTADSKLPNGESGESNIKKYKNDIMERWKRGEMTSADNIHLPDSLKSQTKKLQRTVYGGGGITPDFFVPMDTTLFSNYHSNILGRGVVTQTVRKYIEENRQVLTAKYKKFDTFNQKFEIDQQMLSTLREMADKAKIEFNEQQYNSSLPLLKVQLKALIARDLWGLNEYYQAINEVNNTLQRALEVLNSGEYEQTLKKK